MRQLKTVLVVSATTGHVLEATNTYFDERASVSATFSLTRIRSVITELTTIRRLLTFPQIIRLDVTMNNCTLILNL